MQRIRNLNGIYTMWDMVEITGWPFFGLLTLKSLFLQQNHEMTPLICVKVE